MPHKIEGGVGFGRMNERERDAILALLPDRGTMLEIGTFHGVSAAYWSLCQPRLRNTSIDPFVADIGTDAGSKENWTANATSKQSLFVGTSVDFLRAWNSTRGGFDVIFVDGAHSLKWAIVDLMVSKVLLHKRGTILVHDYGFPKNPEIGGVTKAVRNFCKTEGFRLVQTFHRTAVLKRG